MPEATQLEKFIDERRRAEQLLGLAREKAAAILKKARAAASEAEKQGYKKGYMEGYRQGNESGRKEAEERYLELFQEKLLLLEDKISEFEEQKKQIFATLEKELLDLTLQIARKVIRDEIAARPETVLATLHAALADLNERTQITIRINPEDLPLVSDKSAPLRAELDRLQHYQLIPDPAIERGGVYLETETGDIDATIETQEKELERFLLSTEQQASPSYQE